MLLGRRTPLTTLILALIAVGYVLQLLRDPGMTETFANGPEALRGEWWRLVTSMFLHGGIVHLLLNGWALYQLGSLFELLMGSVRLLGVYFITGIAGSLASAFITGNHSVGASGAIFGLMGALIAFLLKHRDNLTPQAKSLLMQLLLWAGINVFLGFSTPGIDNAAHLGGAAAGLLLGFTLPEPR